MRRLAAPNRFAGGRRVIGSRLLVNNYPMTVAGVSVNGELVSGNYFRCR